jgi:hypothetical protein
MALDCILKRQPLFPYCSEFSSDRAMFQTFANTGQTGCMFWVSDMSSGHLNLITTVYIHLKKQFLHHLQQVVQVGCLFLFIFPKVLHLLSCKKTPYDLLYCRCDFYVQILLGSRNKKGSNPRRFLVFNTSSTPSYIFLLSCPRFLSCHWCACPSSDQQV